MRQRTIWERLFWSPNYFTIAIRRKREGEAPVWERGRFQPEYVMPVSREHWAADPMLAEEDGRTYLFYEAVHHGKGRIEVAELGGDGRPTQPIVAVERDYHLSYPFVFRRNGIWYMIPESCAAGQVQLLRATHFPEQWEYVTTLLPEAAVDSTVEEIDGRLLLLTFLPHGENERVTPRAYWLELREGGDASLEPLPWPDFDPLLVRGAGRLLRRDGEYIRPAQINRDLSYGDGLRFSRCQPRGSHYRETELGQLPADGLSVPGWKADGTHTYAETAQWEVIDLRCQLPDPLKLWRRLTGR